MLKQAFDRDHLQQYVVAVRDRLDAPELQGAVAAAAAGTGVDRDSVATLRSALPDVTGDLASSGGGQTKTVPYLSRDPIQSLLQSTVEEKLRQTGVRDQTPVHRDFLGDNRSHHRVMAAPDALRPHRP